MHRIFNTNLKHINSPGWETVALLGWGSWSVDYKRIQMLMRKGFDAETIKSLRTFVYHKVGEIDIAVKAWENRIRDLSIGSDDGYSDVRYHVVGLGELEFNKVIADPTVLEKRYNATYGTADGYKESFAYCFH